MKNNLSHWVSLIAAYIFLLFWNGYWYGHGDTIEVFPYAKWLIDNSLYPNDFYIQNVVEHVPNERFLLAHLMALFGNAMPQAAFFLQMICSLFLLEGLLRIGKKFIQSEALVWVAVLIPFTILFGKNLGGNEMYIPLFTSSTLAKALGVWAVYYFLIEKTWLVYILLSVAAFIQPIVSIQLFLLLTGSRLLFEFLESKKIILKNYFPIGLYLLTGGVWIFLMNKNFSEGSIDNLLLFDIFEFRVAHHYFPSYFPIKNYLLLLPLFIFGLIFFWKNKKTIFYFFVLTLLGMGVFFAGVEFFQNSSVLAAQWFKATIWLKSFSVIAVFSLLEKQVSFLGKDFFSKIISLGLRLVGIASIYFLMTQTFLLPFRYYDLPFVKNANSEVEISQKAKLLTSKDALFLTPIHLTHFKYHSERSSYIDHKAMIHRKSILPIWYDRVQEVYGINVEDRRGGENVFAKADTHYKSLTMNDLEVFSKKGVNYFLTFRTVDLPLEKIAENQKYVIYELP